MKQLKKQRDITLSIAILACVILVGFVIYLIYLLSREVRFADTARDYFSTYRTREIVYRYPALYYVYLAILLLTIIPSLVLGIVLLAMRQPNPPVERGLVVATGVLAIVGFALAGIPNIIVAFITYARLAKALKQGSAPTPSLTATAE